MIYDTIEEVIGYANTTTYGLGGYIRGSDDEQIDYICSKLRTGNIAVNNTSYLIPQVPFG
jgi:acyl-CoA reductase-like NAD-dependent aldehyde dehydrogenase